MSHPYPAARVVTIYVFFAALWLLVSDRALARLSAPPHALNLLQSYESWAFVAITAALLYVVSRWAENKARRAHQTLEMIRAGRLALGRATDEPSLVRQVCQLIVDVGGYKQAWVDFAAGGAGEATSQTTWPAPPQVLRKGRVLSLALALVDRTSTTAPHVFGTLNICATEPTALNAENTKLLSELADDLAHSIMTLRARVKQQQEEQELRRRVSVENAQLCERLEEQAIGLELLYEVGRRFSSSPDLQEALEHMARRCAQIFQADACLVQTVEGDRLTVRASHYSDDAQRAEIEKWIESNSAHVGEGAAGQLVATGQPAVSGSIDPTSMPPQGDTDDCWKSHDWLLTPLRTQDRTIGILTLIASHRRRTFSEHDLALAQEIANQAAAALENARLHQKTNGSLDRLWALSQISRAINSSLDKSQVLATIARYAAELSGSDAAGIYELDKKQQTLFVSASHNARLEFVQAVNNENIRVGQGVIGRAAVDHGCATALDTQADPDLPFPRLDAQEGYRSILAVPMLGRDALIGGIVLWRRLPQPFDEDTVKLISTLADQSVVAIENARLYQEANQRLEEVSLIRAVALEGAAGRPFDEIMTGATQRLRYLWATHRLGFLFPDETRALRVHASYVGLSPQMQRTLRLPPGKGLSGWAFETGRPVVVPDVRLDPRYISTSPDTRSEMDAPLLVGDHVIGVINVESTHLNAFSAHDVHLLTALAGQLALLLDNAQAHRDLAERAEQLQAAFDELAEAERLKDQLVRNISHELRTPMTFLKGYVELLRDETFGPLPPALRQPLEIMCEKTSTVARLVERIVDLQAVRPDTLKLEPLRLTQLTQEATDRWTRRAQQAGVQLEWSPPAELPLVVGDRQRLAEALDYLLGNAIKFNGKDGQVTITLRAENETAHLEIADTGIGIPSEKLARIFDRFYQVDGTTRRRFNGAGVGLALVKQIVEAHGGQVWAESTGPGQGSTFHLVLPTAPASWVQPPFDSSALLVYNSVSAG
jgi:signal transduction histidine kinase